MANDSVFERNSTYSADNFTQDILSEDVVFRLNNLSHFNMANSKWRMFSFERNAEDPKVNSYSYRVNSMVSVINYKNKKIKRYSY